VQRVSASLELEIAQKVGAPRRVAIEGLGRPDAVGPEKAERGTQFAPGRQYASVVHEAELDWPNDTLGAPCLTIGV
jgi:hypothetical protein